jgi:hypothetical protein
MHAARNPEYDIRTTQYEHRVSSIEYPASSIFFPLFLRVNLCKFVVNNNQRKSAQSAIKLFVSFSCIFVVHFLLIFSLLFSVTSVADSSFVVRISYVVLCAFASLWLIPAVSIRRSWFVPRLAAPLSAAPYTLIFVPSHQVSKNTKMPFSSTKNAVLTPQLDF